MRFYWNTERKIILKFEMTTYRINGQVFFNFLAYVIFTQCYTFDSSLSINAKKTKIHYILVVI